MSSPLKKNRTTCHVQGRPELQPLHPGRPALQLRPRRRHRRAPAAVPAPAPARSYLVFFDWDKATLTDRARQIIREAADNSTKVQYTRIEVNGYTDTSGTPKYNQGLSVRRAKAVQAELVKDGVPQNAITIQGFGDTNLLVPTGPACASRRTAGSRSSSADLPTG